MSGGVRNAMNAIASQPSAGKMALSTDFSGEDGGIDLHLTCI